MSRSKRLRDEPFHERYSHVFGQVRLYAPEGKPDTWNSKPWVLTTERDGKSPKPIRVQLKPEHILPAFQSPGLIWPTMLWPDDLEI